MHISSIFEKLYKECLNELPRIRGARKQNEAYKKFHERQNRRLLARIRRLAKAANNSRKSAEERTQAEQQERSLRAYYDLGSSRSRTKSSSRKPDSDSQKAISRFQRMVATLDRHHGLTLPQEALLETLFLMWQPHQEVDRNISPGAEAFRVVYALKKRSSQVRAELKHMVEVTPIVRTADGTLTPIGFKRSAMVADILDCFRVLRPFLTEPLAIRIAGELKELLKNEDLGEASLLPGFYADLWWQKAFEQEGARFPDYESYRDDLIFWRHGRTTKGDLIDFSIIKLDELFKEFGINKGRDRHILRILNIMNGRKRLFLRNSDIHARRRDLWNKPKWKQLRKMRKLELLAAQ